MRILVVTQYFWPENFLINDLVIGLKDKNHDVTVLTGIPNYPHGSFFPGYGVFNKRTEDYRGIKVFRVPLVPRGKSSPLRLVINYFSFALFAGLLGPFYCRGKYDIIFVYEPSPITVCLPSIVLKMFKAIPMILWVQDLWPESISAIGAIRSKQVLKLLELFVRFIYHQCDRVLIQSRAFASPIKKLGVDASKIFFFPNSVEDVYRPVPAEVRASENLIMPVGFRVVFAGNIGAAQDFETILSAAELLKKYSDIHLVIVGDGRMKPWVEEQIKARDLRGNVHLLGRYPRDKIPLFFSFANALLVTLRKDPIFTLTVPSKVQAYLACAKPIIAALDGEGARVIVEAGAGFTCPAGDHAALARAVLKAYGTPQEKLQRIGWNGKLYSDENFSRYKLLNKLDLWIEQMVENSNRKRYNNKSVIKTD